MSTPNEQYYPVLFEPWEVSAQKAALLYGEQLKTGISPESTLGLPIGQTSQVMTYVNEGASDNDLVKTVTYQPSGKVLTINYIGTTNNIQSVTIS